MTAGFARILNSTDVTTIRSSDTRQKVRPASSRGPTVDFNEDYSIETICPEFTSLCPKTGQPDFGTLTLTYTPDQLCYELKSLKMYLQQYRNHGAFYEAVTNQILDDLVAVTRPRSMTLIGAFTPRGGIRTNVTVSYHANAAK